MLAGVRRGGAGGAAAAASNPKHERLAKMLVHGFKTHGFALRSVAVRYLVNALDEINEEEVDESVENIIQVIENENLTSTTVGLEVVERVVLKMVEGAEEKDEDVARKHFSVIDAFSVPRLRYNVDRKAFFPVDTQTAHLHGSAEQRAEMFRDRYQLIHQRILRHPLFTPPSFGEEKEYYRLIPIESLLGVCSDQTGSLCLFGMLTQLQEGRWFLEDLNGNVELDLSRANPTAGLFVDGSFVLVEGVYDGSTFHVDVVGQPPPEPRHVSMAHFAGQNFFGGDTTELKLNYARLQHVEEAAEDEMIVSLSDVFLDQPAVVARLRTLFTGYSDNDMAPLAFVLMGNFSSKPYGPESVRELRGSFDALANLIAEFPALAKCNFVMVPGPLDVGPGNVFPRPAFTASLTERLRHKVPNLHLASNPCRLRYCTQEIVIMRDDVMSKMRRNCVLTPTTGNSDAEITQHLARTLIDQAHLCPLPPLVRPVYWAYDAALTLYPTPNLVVLGDRFDDYVTDYEKCLVTNPGRFATTGVFHVYYPATRKVERSKVN